MLPVFIVAYVTIYKFLVWNHSLLAKNLKVDRQSAYIREPLGSHHGVSLWKWPYMVLIFQCCTTIGSNQEATREPPCCYSSANPYTLFRSTRYISSRHMGHICKCKQPIWTLHNSLFNQLYLFYSKSWRSIVVGGK